MSQVASSALDTEETWKLLMRCGVGRLATAAGSRADIFVVNYLVDEQTILFRSAPGSKIAQLQEAPEVAFEVDGKDPRRYWSIVIRGTARRLTGQAEIILSRAPELVSWGPGQKSEFVRIVPSSITGRQVDRVLFRHGVIAGSTDADDDPSGS